MRRVWARIRWPIVAAALLFALHLLLGHLLAASEPLAAVISGRYSVALGVVALLSARLALLFAIPPWALYALATAVLEREPQ